MAKKNKTSLSKKISLTILILSLPAFLYVYFLDTIYPNTYVANINLTAKSFGQALNILQSKVNAPEVIVLVNDDKTFNIPTNSISLNYDFKKSAERAVQLGRSGN